MTKFCKSALAALKPNIAVYIILLITMVFMYYKCLGHEFVNWDDSRFVLNNEMIQGFTFSHLKMALTKSFDRVFAPVNMLSYMLDYELWGLSFSGFIFTNLVLHFCNSLIFYHLCLKIFNFRSGAALAAFIFLAHPLQVESVAWISERKNVLSMFFFLLSFLSFLSFRTAKKPASIFYYASLIAYSLALLTKMASAFLPLVLALYDYCYYRNEQTRRRVYEYMPYIFLVAALVLVNMRTYVFNEIPLGDYAANGFNTFITMVTVLPKYLIQIIWPQFLSIIYSPPVKEAIDGEVLVSVLVILLLFFEGIILFRSKRRLFFWYAFFFIAFLPVSQIIPLGTIMQDRYCYYPLLGLCGLIGLISGNYFQQMPRTIRNMAIVVIFLSPLALLPLLSQKRVEIWKDSLTLWRETATAGIGNRFGFDSHYVENQLTTEYYLKAEELLKSGNREEALRYYMQTLSADPLHSEALIKTGILLLDMGKYEVAHGYLTRVTEKFPKTIEVSIVSDNIILGAAILTRRKGHTGTHWFFTRHILWQ